MESPTSKCQICHRSSSNHLPFYCPTCARNVIYNIRIQNAHALLDKEVLSREVERIIEHGIDSTRSPSHTDANTNANAEEVDAGRQVAYDRARVAHAQSIQKSREISIYCDTLREEAKGLREFIKEKKALLARKQASYAAAASELTRLKACSFEPLEKELEATKSRWDAVHNRTTESRVFLCREVATLHGLQQRKRKKGMSGRDIYLIGGVPIVDVRDLNSMEKSFCDGCPANTI